MAQIELRNRDGDVIDFAIVDDEYYEHLNQFRWSKNTSGYVRNSDLGQMHRYIVQTLLGKEIGLGQVVDHDDGKKTNNQTRNIQIVTRQQNARNRRKQKNTSSKFRGVYKTKYKTFETNYTCQNGDKKTKRFNSELLAAHQYNLWIDLDGCPMMNKNEFTIEELKQIEQELLEYKEVEKRPDPHGVVLPKGIYLSNTSKSYVVKFKGKIYGSFKTLNDALDRLNTLQAEYKRQLEEQERIRLSTPILRNKDGHAIIELNGIAKGKYMIVDDDYYYHLQATNFMLPPNGHPKGYFDNEYCKAHIRVDRYICQYLAGKDLSGYFTLIHLNDNDLDMRLTNLKGISHSERFQQIEKRTGLTSKFMGVSFHKQTKKFRAYAKFEGKGKTLGYFDTEIAAATKRDEFIKENNIPSPLNFK